MLIIDDLDKKIKGLGPLKTGGVLVCVLLPYRRRKSKSDTFMYLMIWKTSRASARENKYETYTFHLDLENLPFPGEITPPTVLFISVAPRLPQTDTTSG